MLRPPSPPEVIWKRVFDSCQTLTLWNSFILPMMKTEGEGFKIAAAKESKLRGYIANKSTQQYEEAL